ncbi:MAG: hypothetical protein QM753_18545 [Thermomicrobiales bacterium]
MNARSHPPSFTVHAQSEAALVQAVLDQVILATQTTTSAPAASFLIGFRSVADDLPALLAQAVGDAFGEADAHGATAIGAEVSGVMPIDEGLRCWGFVSVVPAAQPTPAPRIAGTPKVTREGRTLTAVVSIATHEDIA